MISRPLKALQCRVIFGKTFSKSSANCGARRRKQWIWVLLNYASHQVLLLMLSIKTPFSAHFNKLLANLKMPINIQMRDKNVDDCACTICIGKLMNYRSLWFMGTVNKDADRLVSRSQVINFVSEDSTSEVVQYYGVRSKFTVSTLTCLDTLAVDQKPCEGEVKSCVAKVGSISTRPLRTGSRPSVRPFSSVQIGIFYMTQFNSCVFFYSMLELFFGNLLPWLEYQKYELPNTMRDMSYRLNIV